MLKVEHRGSDPQCYRDATVVIIMGQMALSLVTYTSLGFKEQVFKVKCDLDDCSLLRSCELT